MTVANRLQTFAVDGPENASLEKKNRIFLLNYILYKIKLKQNLFQKTEVFFC